VKSPLDGELIIAFGKEDKSKDLKDAIERAQSRNLNAFSMSQQRGRATRS